MLISDLSYFKCLSGPVYMCPDITILESCPVGSVPVLPFNLLSRLLDSELTRIPAGFLTD